MPKPEKTPLNISINKRNFDLLEKQQKFFPLLTKGDLVNSILDIYFKGSGTWCPKKIDEDTKANETSIDIEREIRDFKTLQDTLKETLDKPSLREGDKPSKKFKKERQTRRSYK